MKNHLLLLPFLFLPTPGVMAAVGIDAAPFLKIDGGVRAAAMGGAFTAIADDASSVFYNPAGPALMSSAEFFFAHNQWIEELNTEHLSYVQPVSETLTYYAAGAMLRSPVMDSLDSAGYKTGSFNSVDAMYGVGATVIEKGIIAGCFVKAIVQSAYEEKGSAYAGDIGLISTNGSFRFGATAQNLGGKMKIYREEFKLPQTYRGGIAYRVADRYWLSGEAAKLGEAEVSYAAGTEGEFPLSESAKAFLRLGYNSGRPKNTGPGVSAGLGLTAGTLSLDYAFSPYGDLGVAHRVSLAIRFGKERGAVSVVSPGRDVPELQKPENDATIAPSEFAHKEEISSSSIAGTYASFLSNAQRDLEDNELSAAFGWYGKASESIPVDDKRQTHILERQGLILIKQNNCERAKKFYSAAIRTAKKNNLSGKDVSNAYSGLAYCQEKSGNLKWAEANYQAAINATDDAALKVKLQKRLAALGKR